MRASCERALLVIYDYIADIDKPVRPRYGVGRFEQVSYARWAADEIIWRIVDNQSTHPIIILEDFVCEMWRYSQIRNPHYYIFMIALQVGEDILDIYRAME